MYGSQAGFLGCRPCPNGTYSSLWHTLCSPCDAGFFAQQFWDPMLNSMRGAAACTQCPVLSPHTTSIAPSTETDCSQCPSNHFKHANATCMACKPPCDITGMQYESTHCSLTHDRVCTDCDNACPMGFYTKPCQQHLTPIDCLPCNNKPTKAQYLPNGNGNCPWECDTGYYLTANLSACQLCTVHTLASCPPGRLFSQ